MAGSTCVFKVLATLTCCGPMETCCHPASSTHADRQSINNEYGGTGGRGQLARRWHCFTLQIIHLFPTHFSPPLLSASAFFFSSHIVKSSPLVSNLNFIRGEEGHVGAFWVYLQPHRGPQSVAALWQAYRRLIHKTWGSDVICDMVTLMIYTTNFLLQYQLCVSVLCEHMNTVTNAGKTSTCLIQSKESKYYSALLLA